MIDISKFFDILREILEKELNVGGAYANKERMLATFDKSFAKAIARYANEKGISID